MRATIEGGDLNPITDCSITGTFGEIKLKILPDISESKSAAYNDEPVIGRSFPLKTYSHSENRSISMSLHFFSVTKKDADTNLQYLRAIESCVYPQDGDGNTPYLPPPVCKIKCGKLLGEGGVCVVLKQYSVKFPTDVVWDEESYLPIKFDIDTTWDVVYTSTSLPGQEKIATSGA